jgi:RNA polymerase sigma-70 factor, ECF subfamily
MTRMSTVSALLAGFPARVEQRSVVSVGRRIPRSRATGEGEVAAELVDGNSLDSLLAAVGRGDRASFSHLYDLVAPRVLGLATRVLVDPAQAEEVMQDVFLEVWQTADRFDPSRGRGITWILTMTHRRAIDRVRASQSSRDRDERAGIRELASSGPSIEDEVDIAIEHERVLRALATLSELQRESVELAYFQGLTQSEIAQRLDIPIGTVKTRTRDAMFKLRGILGEES